MTRKIQIDTRGYLPTQKKFFKCGAKIQGFIGGMGSGKTHVFLRKCFWAHTTLIGKKGISNGRVIYPTYALAEELFVGPFIDILEDAGIKYSYNVSKHLFKTAFGEIRIFQLQQPKRIVGSELTWAGFDEFDVENWNNCHTAFMKTIGRMRGCSNWQMFFVSTPEGTHYLNKVFVTDNKDGERVYFNADTDENPYNPEGYAEDLKRNYDNRMLDAYKRGLFVNMTQGTVYHAFGKHNVKPVTLDPRLPLVIMCDFNRGQKPMCWNVGQEQGDALHIKYAIHKTFTNTFQMCEILEETLVRGLNLPSNASLPILYFYGDYSGRKETSNSTMNDWEIIEQHFNGKSPRVETLIKPTKSVRDGVAAVNARLHNAKGEVKIFCDPVDAEFLIRDFEMTTWEPSGMREDQSVDERSHAVSAVRYYVDYEYPLRERIKRV